MFGLHQISSCTAGRLFHEFETMQEEVLKEVYGEWSTSQVAAVAESRFNDRLQQWQADPAMLIVARGKVLSVTLIPDRDRLRVVYSQDLRELITLMIKLIVRKSK